MKNKSVGDAVAAQMAAIMESDEYKKLYARPAPQFKKTAAEKCSKCNCDPCECDKNAAAEKCPKCNCDPCECDANDAKCKLTASDILNGSIKGLAKIAAALDSIGFSRGSFYATKTLENVVKEAQDLAFAKDKKEKEDEDKEDKEKAEKGEKDEGEKCEKKDKECKKDDGKKKGDAECMLASDEPEEEEEEEEPEEEEVELSEDIEEPPLVDLPETEIGLKEFEEDVDVGKPEEEIPEVEEGESPFASSPLESIFEGSDEGLFGDLYEGEEEPGFTGRRRALPELGPEEELNFSTATRALNNISKLGKKKGKVKARNRGTCCFPAESSSVKDNKDHFPINNENQARNALARASQYSSSPPWYSGSLSSLVGAVQRKVHGKYPGIKVTKKSKNPKKGSLNSVMVALGKE